MEKETIPAKESLKDKQLRATQTLAFAIDILALEQRLLIFKTFDAKLNAQVSDRLDSIMGELMGFSNDALKLFNNEDFEHYDTLAELSRLETERLATMSGEEILKYKQKCAYNYQMIVNKRK